MLGKRKTERPSLGVTAHYVQKGSSRRITIRDGRSATPNSVLKLAHEGCPKDYTLKAIHARGDLSAILWTSATGWSDNAQKVIDQAMLPN